MHTTPFFQLSGWDISADLKHQISRFDWRSLEITTELSPVSVCALIIKGWVDRQWSLVSFANAYGMFLQDIPRLLNLRLPEEIETQVLNQLPNGVREINAPVIRMQVMFGGRFLPIHIDNTREASLVIPLNNHQGSSTQFFKCLGNPAQLLDPSKCQLTDQVEVTMPTLIDTKIPHAVVCQQTPSKLAPRLSLTVKWPNTKYSKLIGQLA